jgi:multisubunit Na+/H+ antiporter MnhF subunit
MFVDLAIAYALLNFVVIIVLGKYFDRGREKQP